MEPISANVKKIAWLFSALYFASYVMRINFAVMLVKICSDMALPKTDIAIVVTCLTVAYGIGQVVSGFLGDKLNPRHLITVGLTLATVCNIAMFFANVVPIMTVVWTINGFAHSLLWPPIVRLLSLHLSDAEYSYAMVRVSWGSSGATLLLYLVCPLLLYVLSWRVVMLLCAAVGICVTVLWQLTGTRLLNAQKAANGVSLREKASTPFSPIPKFVYLPIALIALGIIAQGLLRDGVTNWMPSYLAESFHISEENAIIAAVVPAITSIVSFALFNAVHRKWFKNEVFCAAVIFGLSAVASLLLYLAQAVLTPILPTAVKMIASVVCMSLIVGAMHGINLMLITVVPKRFAKSGKVSTYSGLLNACTYVGAAISSYGFAALAESFGWNTTILSWFLISAAGIAFCLCAAPLWQRFKSE